MIFGFSVKIEIMWWHFDDEHTAFLPKNLLTVVSNEVRKSVLDEFHYFLFQLWYIKCQKTSFCGDKKAKINDEIWQRRRTGPGFQTWMSRNCSHTALHSRDAPEYKKWKKMKISEKGFWKLIMIVIEIISNLLLSHQHWLGELITLAIRQLVFRW